MSDKTSIAWTDATWNVVTGCTKVSAGCAHCYAERIWPRVAGNKATKYHWWKFSDVRCHPKDLDIPLKWKKPRRIFVPSMGDLFHPSVPDEFIAAVFGVMAACPHHTFLVLTKRPTRMREWFVWVQSPRGCAVDTMVQSCAWGMDVKLPLHKIKGTFLSYPWPLPNVWLGTSCEDQDAVDERVSTLQDTPAAHRFLSLEPLIAPIDLEYPTGSNPEISCCSDLMCGCRGGPANAPLIHGLDWVIVGGESGPKARRCDRGWIRDIVRQCRDAATPCFVKQLGAFQLSSVPGSLLHVINQHKSRSGSDPSEWPEDIRVREIPE